MALLKTVAIIAATLLLIAGAGAGGYYAASSTGSNNNRESSDAGAVPRQQDPIPFQNAGDFRAFKISDGNDVCRMNTASKVAECEYASGVRQTLQVTDDGNIKIKTSGNGKRCEEDLIALSALDSMRSGGGSGDADRSGGEDLVTLASQTRRVTSWTIQVPKELGGDSLDVFDYFEKDGLPWKVEVFEKDAEEPTVIDLSHINNGDWIPSATPTCRNNKRNLLEHVYKSSSASTDAASLRDASNGDRRKLGGIVGAGVAMVGLLAAVTLMLYCPCRRRMRLLVRRADTQVNADASARITDLDFQVAASAIASVAATAAALAETSLSTTTITG